MGLKAEIDWNDIDNTINTFLSNVDEVFFKWLSRLGEECVTLLKSLQTYQDRTANLRNSIGYVILKNGEVINSYFPVDYSSAKEESNKNGAEEGEAYADQIAQSLNSGWVLLVVAGMHYASYVEEIHHLDVIAPGKDYALSNIEDIKERIIKELS